MFGVKFKKTRRFGLETYLVAWQEEGLPTGRTFLSEQSARNFIAKRWAFINSAAIKVT